MSRKKRPAFPGTDAAIDSDAMIRVDHAGEYGAVRIYEGQLAVLGGRVAGGQRIHRHEYGASAQRVQGRDQHLVQPGRDGVRGDQGDVAIGVDAVQLAIAWVLAKGKSIIPVMGARTRAQLQESLSALDVQLSSEEIGRIEREVPAVAGSRYDERQMQMLDSERT